MNVGCHVFQMNVEVVVINKKQMAEGFKSFCSTPLKRSPQRSTFMYPDWLNRKWHLWVLPTFCVTAALMETLVARPMADRKMMYAILEWSWGWMNWHHKKTGASRVSEGGSKKNFGFWQPFCSCKELNFMSFWLWCRISDSWEQGWWQCPGKIHCSSFLMRIIFLPNVTETLFGAKWTFWSG